MSPPRRRTRSKFGLLAVQFCFLLFVNKKKSRSTHELMREIPTIHEMDRCMNDNASESEVIVVRGTFVTR